MEPVVPVAAEVFAPDDSSALDAAVDAAAGKHTLYEALLMQCEIAKTIEKTAVDRLSVCPSDIRLAGAEIELIDMDRREYRMRAALRSLSDRYDYVIVDCPPSLGLLTVNALTAAASVLIPIQCEYYALEGVRSLMDTVSRVKRGLNPALEVEGVLLTMFDGRTNFSAQVAQEVRRFFPGILDLLPG